MPRSFVDIFRSHRRYIDYKWLKVQRPQTQYGQQIGNDGPCVMITQEGAASMADIE